MEVERLSFRNERAHRGWRSNSTSVSAAIAAVTVAAVLFGASVAFAASPEPSIGAGPAASPAPVASPVPAAQWQVVHQSPIAVDDGRIISMSPDGSRFVAAQPAMGYQHGSLCTYEVATGAQIACADLSQLDAGLRIDDVTWSPDGSELAFSERAFMLLQDGDLWVMDAATGDLTDVANDGYSGKLTLGAGSPPPAAVTIPQNPAFTPDGRSLTYSRSSLIGGSQAGNDIVSVPLSGGAPRTIVSVSTEEIGVVYFGLRWAPDGSRLYYSVQHVQHDNPENGIWVVNADGSDAHRLVGAPSDRSWGPAVLQVSSDGANLLAWDPAYAGAYPNSAPVFSVVDTATGASTPVVPLTTPAYSWVSWAGFSPDGGSLLTLTSIGQPILDARVRDIGSSTEHEVRFDDQVVAGWIDFGIPLTWAPNGVAFITGAGHFGTATALTIDDDAAVSSPTATEVASSAP